jgi:hypothetical protein
MRCFTPACVAMGFCLILGGTSLALGASPEGSWFCIREASPVGTLGIRTSDYLLIQPGKAPAPGALTVNVSAITIESGPLKDEMGITAGVLDEAVTPRIIAFTTGDGVTLTCREVR